MSKKNIILISALCVICIIAVAGVVLFVRLNKNNEQPEVSPNTAVETKAKTVSDSPGEISLKDAYEKTIQMIGSDKKPELTNLTIGNNDAGDQIQFQYVFYVDDKVESFKYGLKDGEVQKISEVAAKNPPSEKIPESVIDFGYKGVKSLLEKDSQFEKYLSEYPDMENHCLGGVQKNPEYGWEWHINYFVAGSPNSKFVSFIVNPSSKKVIFSGARGLSD